MQQQQQTNTRHEKKRKIMDQPPRAPPTDKDNHDDPRPPPDVAAAVANTTNNNLAEVAGRICRMLKERQPHHVPGIPPELHPLPPFIAKAHWVELGQALKVAEQPTQSAIPGEYWISLRCDGTGFSKLLPRLRKHGIFGTRSGYSDQFGQIMVHCCRHLMEKFCAKCGYTQSDELTVLVAPTSIVRQERQVHQHGGRVQKLCSLVAATVTADFNYHVMKLCHEQRIDYYTHDFLVTFDCRVGQYATADEALSLMLWRAYDCNINGTQGAVYHCKGLIDGAKKASGLPGDERLQWLYQHGRLPLQDHERDGTYLVKRKCKMEGTNPLNGYPVSYLRSRIEHIPGNMLQLYQDDKVFPSDDTL